MATNDKNIGREWVGGHRKVVGVHPSGAYLVQTEGQRSLQLIPPDQLESEIEFEERAAASSRRMREQAAAREEQERKAQEARDFTYGFAEQFPPARRRRIIEALNKQVRSDGRFLSRKDLIVEKVKEGWTVKGKKFSSPDGDTFLLQTDITKTGLDFAKYLVEQGIRGKKLKTKRRNPPEDFYFTEAPTDPVDVGAWGQEVQDTLEAVRADPQLRLLMGPRVWELAERLRTAPRRSKFFQRVRAGTHVEPVAVDGADEGWYRDAISGQWVVQEEDGSWYLEVPHPVGAFTLGEMAELESLLWAGAERLAAAAQQGMLDRQQREAAVGVVEAADNLAMRLAIHKWHPDPETAAQVKRQALEVLAGEGPKKPHLSVVTKLKSKLLR